LEANLLGEANHAAELGNLQGISQSRRSPAQEGVETQRITGNGGSLSLVNNTVSISHGNPQSQE
jgi:hypothetical protein